MQYIILMIVEDSRLRESISRYTVPTPCRLSRTILSRPNFLSVQEHVDPSLFVIEPVSDVAGLEVTYTESL